MVAPRGHHATSSGGGRGHGGLDRPLLAGAGPSSQVSVTSGPAYMSLQPHNLVTLAPVTLRTVPAHLAVARPPGRQLAGCWAEGVEGAELRATGGAKTPVTQPRPGLVPVPPHVTAAGGLVGPGALVPPVPRGAFARTRASARPAPCLRSGTCPANSCGPGSHPVTYTLSPVPEQSHSKPLCPTPPQQARRWGSVGAGVLNLAPVSELPVPPEACESGPSHPWCHRTAAGCPPWPHAHPPRLRKASVQGASAQHADLPGVGATRTGGTGSRAGHVWFVIVSARPPAHGGQHVAAARGWFPRGFSLCGICKRTKVYFNSLAVKHPRKLLRPLPRTGGHGSALLARALSSGWKWGLWADVLVLDGVSAASGVCS